MAIDDKTIEMMYVVVQSNLFTILRNTLDEKNRKVKVTEKARKLRAEFAVRKDERKKQLLAVMKNIEDAELNENVSEQHRQYVVRLEELMIHSILDIIFSKWINRENDEEQKCEEILTELLQGKNGRIIDVELICEYIETGLFLEGLEFKNLFIRRYFEDAMVFQEYSEKRESEEIYEKSVLRKLVIIENSDLKLKNVKNNMDSYENDLLKYYEQNEFMCALDPAEYINYILVKAREKYKLIENSNRIKKYLNGFMLATIIGYFEVIGGYVWALENWGNACVNYIDTIHIKNSGVEIEKIFFELDKKADYSKISIAEAEKLIILKTIFSKEIMEEWLLLPLLDRLISDNLSMSERNRVSMREDAEHCVKLFNEIERNEREILEGSQVLKVATNKQNRAVDNYAEKNEYYMTYMTHHGCLKYLLSIGEDGKKKILCLGEYQSPRENQGFLNMYRHFAEMHSFQINQKENYGDDFYLNQFIHLDAAVELFYGISRMVSVTQKTAKNLKSEIISLSNVIVSTQKRIKCGMGKILHDCFELQISSRNQKYTEQECGKILRELTQNIQKTVADIEIENIRDNFRGKILELNWEEIDNNMLDMDGELNFSKDYIATISKLIQYYIVPDRRRRVNDKIRNSLYDKGIDDIADIVQGKWKNRIQDRLRISQEAWRYTLDCFPELHGASGRDKDSRLYKEIQHALINANYQ